MNTIKSEPELETKIVKPRKTSVRKVKFGLNLDEVVFDSKKKIRQIVKRDNVSITCLICQESKPSNEIKYSNCKLKGTKSKQIGRYKKCDKAICEECIRKCQEFKIGDKVRITYKKRRERVVYSKGKIKGIYGKNYIVEKCVGEKELILNKSEILYKYNECPWCRSHRLVRWQNNTKKYPKKKQKC